MFIFRLLREHTHTYKIWVNKEEVSLEPLINFIYTQKKNVTFPRTQTSGYDALQTFNSFSHLPKANIKAYNVKVIKNSHLW